jgi:hypothetical protein
VYDKAALFAYRPNHLLHAGAVAAFGAIVNVSVAPVVDVDGVMVTVL